MQRGWPILPITYNPPFPFPTGSPVEPMCCSRVFSTSTQRLKLAISSLLISSYDRSLPTNRKENLNPLQPRALARVQKCRLLRNPSRAPTHHLPQWSPCLQAMHPGFTSDILVSKILVHRLTARLTKTLWSQAHWITKITLTSDWKDGEDHYYKKYLRYKKILVPLLNCF